MPRGFRRWHGKLDLIIFKFAGKEYRIDPNEELAIEETMLSAELARQASKQAWIGVVAAMGRVLESKRKYEVDVVKAELGKEIRQAAAKKPTEPALKAAVQRHPRHKEAFGRYLQAMELAGKLSALENAFRTRDFDLRELSSRRRGERAAAHG